MVKGSLWHIYRQIKNLIFVHNFCFGKVICKYKNIKINQCSCFRKYHSPMHSANLICVFKVSLKVCLLQNINKSFFSFLFSFFSDVCRAAFYHSNNKTNLNIQFCVIHFWHIVFSILLKIDKKFIYFYLKHFCFPASENKNNFCFPIVQEGSLLYQGK